MGLRAPSYLSLWNQVSPCNRSQTVRSSVLQLKKSNLPARIERWVFLIQEFDYTFKYKSGSEKNSRCLIQIDLSGQLARAEDRERCRGVCEIRSPDSNSKNHDDMGSGRAFTSR